ncbi:MAG: hypothetical protein R3F59_03395 [Myxococcota bacterium]
MLPRGDRIALPAEDVPLVWIPFHRQRLVAEAVGYRPLEVVVGRPRRELRLLLVPEHGGAGTWTPEEIP